MIPDPKPEAPAAAPASAHESLAGLFATELAEESGQQQQPSAPAPDDQHDGQPEADAAPADVPETEVDQEVPATPSGMSPADAAVFAQLTPQMQSWLLNREKQRNGDFTTKAQQVAATRREAEAEHARAAQGNGQLLQKMQQYDEILTRFTAQTLAPPDPSLRQTDPDAYDTQMGEYLHRKHAQEVAQTEQTRVRQEATQLQRQQYQASLGAEQARLQEMAPELFDAKAGNQLKAATFDYAVSQGIPAERLAYASATEVTLLLKAMRYDAAQRARQTAKTVQAPAPRTTQPGPARGTGQGRIQTAARAVETLKQNGSVSALAAAYKAELMAERR